MVDGNNVIGAGAQGWWRDVPAAVSRLVERLRCHASCTGRQLVLVLDAPQPGLPAGESGGITVLYASRRGRDAADDRNVELLEQGEVGPAEVVTSDRELASRVRALGASATGAGAFLARLEAEGC